MVRGWFRERYRHYLAAKGVSTSRYLSRFRTRRVLPSGEVVFVNPEGQKIKYMPGYERLATTAKKDIFGKAEAVNFPSPDDVAYVLDEAPEGTVPGDVQMMTPEWRAEMEALEKLKNPEEIRESIKMRRRWVAESEKEANDPSLSPSRRKSARESAKIWREVAEREEDILSEGGFRREVARLLKENRNIAGSASGKEYDVNTATIYPTEGTTIDFPSVRHTIVHEQGHIAGSGVKRGEKSTYGHELEDEFRAAFDANAIYPRPTAPTDYGTKVHSEDFAESFAASVLHPSGEDNEVRPFKWGSSNYAHRKRMLEFDERELEGAKEALAVAKERVQRYGQGDTYWQESYKRNVKRLKDAEKSLAEEREKMAELDAARDAWPKRVEWMRQNVPGFVALSAREREELSSSPRALVAEQLAKRFGQETRAGARRGMRSTDVVAADYLARKRVGGYLATK